MRLAVPSAALPHALRKTVMGTVVPMEIKTPGTIAGPVRSALFRTARQQRKKRLANCWMNVSGKPGSATPPCGIGWRNVQTGIPGKLRRQEIYSPLAVFPIVQIHGKSGTASGKRTSITTGCPGFWYLSFRVPCCVPSCRGQAWAPFRAGPEYQSHSPLFSGMGPEHTALTEVPHSNSAPR